jgi:hypothetical protein
MPTSTYTPLATVTLGTATASVVFSSIPATYRDLILVADGVFLTDGFAQNFWVRVNGSTSSIYTSVRMSGNGSTTSSGTDSDTLFYLGGANNNQKFNIVLQAMDYSATDKHKTFLARQNAAAYQTYAGALRFGSTNAITSITFLTANASTIKYDAGSTFSLYGVIA